MTAEQLRMALFKDVLTGKLTQSKDAKELKAIDDEYFDIYQVPSTWDIVTLQESCYIHARIGWQALRKDEHQKSGEYLLITGTDFKDGLVDYSTCVYVSKERYEMDEKIQIKNDDILVTKDGSIGKVAVVKELPMPATLNAGVFVIRPDDRFDKRYIEYLFQGSYFTHFVNLVKSGTTIKHLNQNKLLQFKIPVPSKEEQQEIVRALDKLLPYVDKFESLDNHAKAINSKFPEEMKKSVLQYAIMGKLVEQRGEEGNANELFNILISEKERLVNSGQILKKKPTPPFYDNEYPFDIPDTWKWVQLSDVSIIQEGAGIRKFQYRDSGTQILCVTNILEGSVDLEKKKLYISTEEYKEKYLHLTLNKGDIVTSCSGGSWGKVSFFNDDATIMLNTSTLRMRFFNDLADNEYLYYVCQSPLFKNQLVEQLSGMQPNFGYAHYSRICFPLPPLKEQRRIVERLKKILPYCDRLIDSLN